MDATIFERSELTVPIAPNNDRLSEDANAYWLSRNELMSPPRDIPCITYIRHERHIVLWSLRTQRMRPKPATLVIQRGLNSRTRRT